jgi:hypothetical protein
MFFILIFFLDIITSGCWLIDKPGYGKALEAFSQSDCIQSEDLRIYGIIPPKIRIGLVSGYHRAVAMKHLNTSYPEEFKWIPLYLFDESVTTQVILS